MQDLSFVPKAPHLTVDGLSFSMEVFSFENLYTLPMDAVPCFRHRGLARRTTPECMSGRVEP